MNRTNVGLGILAVAVGLLLIIAPETSIRIVVMLLGVGGIANGIRDFARVLPLSENSRYRRTAIMNALLSIIVGVLAVCLPLALFNTVQNIVRIMLYVVAAYLVIAAVADFYLVYKLHEEGRNSKILTGNAVWSVIIAVILFLVPSNFAVILLRILGVVMLLAGAAFTVYSWNSKDIAMSKDDVDVRDDTDTEAGASADAQPSNE